MKNQTSRILFMFISMGCALLGIGCLAEPSPNNQINSNQNTSNQNASNQISSSERNSPEPTCTINQTELEKAIPQQLKDQYNKNFTISFAGEQLVFKGFIYGKGNILQQLFDAFDKFRGKNCMNQVSFQGNTENDKFYWCLNADCSPPESPAPTPAPKCDVGDIVKNSNLKNQLNQNLFYNYSATDRVLEFSGFVRDAPKSGQFISLFGQLQNEINNGCITKITFAPGSRKTALLAGFEWMLCDPLCECAGECRNCPCSGPTPDTNGNINRSNSP